MARQAKFEPILRRNSVNRTTRELSAHVKKASQANQQREQAAQNRSQATRRKAEKLGIPAGIPVDDERGRSAVDMLAEAEREHLAASQSRETSPAATDLT
jgi:hypothetical protein